MNITELNTKISESCKKLYLHRAEFFGKTQIVSTPGAGLNDPSPKSCNSSPTMPRSPPSTTSVASSLVSD